MAKSDWQSKRRRFLQSLGTGAGAALFAHRGLFAEALELKATASTAEGPFYLDQDALGH
jgi:hypothetical protein